MKTGKFCKCGKEITISARRCRDCYRKGKGGNLSKGISRKRYYNKDENK